MMRRNLRLAIWAAAFLAGTTIGGFAADMGGGGAGNSTMTVPGTLPGSGAGAAPFPSGGPGSGGNPGSPTSGIDTGAGTGIGSGIPLPGAPSPQYAVPPPRTVR